MARFKVGDYVTIARLGKYSTPDEWGYMLGKTAMVTNVFEKEPPVMYYIDTPRHNAWAEYELEPSKEHKVLEILRNYEKSRNNMD